MKEQISSSLSVEPKCRQFLPDREGAGVLLLALMLPVMMMASSLAVDLGSAYFGRQKLQTAADATSLAIAKRSALNASLPVSELDAFGRAFLATQLDGIDYAVENLDIDTIDASAHIELSGRAKGVLTNFFDQELVTYNVDSQAAYGRLAIEVALVLDNTRSISNSELAGIKEAGNLLIDGLSAGVEQYQNSAMKVAVLPFTGGIRLPPSEQNAWWLDRAGSATHHFDHIQPYIARDTSGNSSVWRPTRFELFDMIDGVEWAGCVENRPYPNDVRDTPPNSADPDSLFVPYFAFDLPDGNSRNNWIDDDPASCGSAPNSLFDNIEHTCKYGDPARPGAYNGRTGYGNENIPWGPNLYCTTPEILPLTNNLDDVRDKLAEMINDHVAVTDLTVGIAWGWRALSPEEPLTQGADNENGSVRKVMVVMTDGENWSTANEGFNYGAWGFPGDGRLSSTINHASSSQSIKRVMNTRTIEVCDNAKAAGIEIIAINFGGGSGGRAIMSDCASSTSMFFDADNIDELKSVFSTIGRSLSALRLTN